MDKQLRCRRELSYLFNSWNDDGPNIREYPEADEDTIVVAVIHFFHTKSRCIQPFKAYFSAIVYAKCMERYFGINFWEALSDPELMFDDTWFTPYNQEPEIYEQIVDKIGDVWQYGDSIRETVNYFKKEFLVDEDDEFTE